MIVEFGLNIVKQKEKEQFDDIFLVNDNRIRNCRFCGRNYERCNCFVFGQICVYCKKKNYFVVKCLVKSKVFIVQEKFYLSIVGVLSGEGCEVVIFNVLKDVDSMIGYEVVFLMDMGVECNLLFLDVYKGVIGDLDLNFFDI